MWKRNTLYISIFVLALAMLITLLVLWIVFMVQDYHTIRELMRVEKMDSGGRWAVLSMGIVFFSLIIATLSVFFANMMRGAYFRHQQKSFVNMMTHELKLPIASIRMFGQTLQKKNVPESQREHFVSLLLRDCDRMHLLVDHLLKLQQIERRQLPLDMRHLNAVNFFENFAKSWTRPLALASKEKEAWIHADPVLIEYALTNLVVNAEKYSNGKAPKLSISVEDKWLEYHIEDEATLIPKKYFKQIFKRFFRIPNLETRRHNGTGLGLYIVHYITRLHKGQIMVNHRENELGNKFTLRLPLTK